MKRILCIGLVMAGMMSYAQQQVRVGFLDVNRVLEGLSEYQTSNAQLETKIALWKEEAETRQKQIDTLQKILDTEKPLLTQEIIEERTEDIAFEQEQLDAYKQKRFGPEGDWMAQKVIILQPVQDKILDAVPNHSGNAAAIRRAAVVASVSLDEGPASNPPSSCSDRAGSALSWLCNCLLSRWMVPSRSPRRCLIR